MSDHVDPRRGVPRRLLEPPRRGPYKRLFAWVLARLQTRYGREIDERKQHLLERVRGTVVEIGAGAGANLAFYPDDAELLLVEPNAHLWPYLAEEAAARGKHVDLRDGTAEHMDVADGSADFVVSTLVLCSVHDPRATLAEVLRVLKPGGEFLFVEHVAASRGTRLRRWQRRLRGFWRVIGDGCTLDRETWTLLEDAGFDEVEIEHFEADNIAIVRPHIAGAALKR